MIKIKELREERGIKQKDLADYLGISAGNLCEWEKGRIEPSIENLLKLCNFFNVSLDCLVGKESYLDDDVSPVATAGLNDKEAEIIKNYRLSNDVGKTAIEITAESFARKATSVSKERRA